MDQIFDRLGNLLKSMFEGDENVLSSKDFADPDMQSAWEELDDYLQNEKAAKTGTSGGRFNSTGRRPATTPTGVPIELHADYRYLEIPIDSPLEDVNKAYKRLARKYHPDRHASDPTKMEQATRKMQTLNHSYYRIRKYLQTGTIG